MAEDDTITGQIQAASETWGTMPRGTEAEKEDSERYYQQKVFPLVRRTFAAREADKIPRSYDLAVMTAGGSPEALILSLDVLRPQKAFFLHSDWPESVQCVDRVTRILELPASRFNMTEVNPDDTLDTYAGVKQAVEWAGQPDQVVVDISGGKKSMSAAAALAAYVIGADIVYVNSEFWQPLGKPRPGSEFLALLSHPYTIFGDLVQREAERFYAKHDYRSAERLFEQLARDVPALVDYEHFRRLSASYQAWDCFNLPRACSEMEALVDELQRRRPLEAGLKLMPHLAQLWGQAETLGRLRPLTGRLRDGDTPDLRILQHGQQAVDLVFSLHANALRREREGRLDMAALLLYRVLELLAQRRLALRGIDTRAPDLESAGINAERWHEAFQSCFGRTPREGLPGRLGALDAYVLLFTQGDALAKGLDWGSLQNAVDARNRSLFAHGFRLLKDKDYRRFQRVVTERLKVFCRAEGLDMEGLVKSSEFVQPFDPDA